MLRFWPALALLAFAACKGGGRVAPADPIASASGTTDPSSPIAQPTGTSGSAPDSRPSVLRDGAAKGIPKELKWAEVVVNTKTSEGTSYLAQFILSDEWMFWKKADDGAGVVTWTFVRPKHPGVRVEDLKPRTGASRP